MAAPHVLAPLAAAPAAITPDGDWLHKMLRHTIRISYGELDYSPARVLAFRGITYDPSSGVSEGALAMGDWACYQSADRLCELLVGDALRGTPAAKKAVSLGDVQQRDREFAQMKLCSGYVLVRFDVEGGGAGHAYIFLSCSRIKGEEVKGFIYQTNVGCGEGSFDITGWIADQRSEELVEIGAYSQSILTGFRNNPVQTYESKYMLDGTHVSQAQNDLLVQNAARYKVTFLWKLVDDGSACQKMSAFLSKWRNWAEVQPAPKVKLTGC
jgi:hypothetical protein